MIEEYRGQDDEDRMTSDTMAARDKYVARSEQEWPVGYSDRAVLTHYMGRVGDVAVFRVRLREKPPFGRSLEWWAIDLWANKSMARLTGAESKALAAMLSTA